MKVWVMTEIWDDSDPGDKASLSKVSVFGTLEGAREAFRAKQGKPGTRGEYRVDADPHDLEVDFGPDIDIDDMDSLEWAEAVYRACLREPEKYTWTTGRDDDGGWDGGTIVEITEVEVEP